MPGIKIPKKTAEGGPKPAPKVETVTPPPTEKVEAKPPALSPIKQELIDLVPASHAAKKRAVEAAMTGAIPYSKESIQRERKKFNKRDQRERATGLAGATLRIVSDWRLELPWRIERLKDWLWARSGKSPWRKKGREITEDWIAFQRLAGEPGPAPGPAEFGKALGVSRFKGRNRLQRLVSRGGETSGLANLSK